MNEWFYEEKYEKWPEWKNIILPENMAHWKNQKVRTGTLNGNNELEIKASNTEKIIIPLYGEGTDVAYTINDKTSTIFLRGRENINREKVDILYLPSGAAAVLRGEAQVAVVETSSSNNKNVRFISKESI